MASSKTLFVFSTAKLPQHERVAIRRKLFGYNDSSNKGRYSYKRKGLLTSLEHSCPCKSVIVIDTLDSSKLERFFREHSVSYDKYQLKEG